MDNNTEKEGDSHGSLSLAEDPNSEVKEEPMSPESCENSRASNVLQSELDTFTQDYKDVGDTEADLDNIVNSESNNKSVNALVRVTCKDKLDTHVPFTQQPQERIDSVVNTILDKFPALEELGIRRRVRLFLKSHRHSLRKTLASCHGHVKNIAEEGNQSEEEAITVDGDNNKSFNTFVRLACKEKLDTKVPLTQQPQELLEEVIDAIMKEFPDCEPNQARKRVRIFLKNCRKEKKKSVSSNISQPRKRKQDVLPPSPWSVLSLSEFLQYKCPICVYFCKDEHTFLSHAYESHKESVVYLCTLSVDFAQPEAPYEVNLSWNANSIEVKCDDKSEPATNEQVLFTEEEQMPQSPGKVQPDECKIEPNNDSDTSPREYEEMEPVSSEAPKPESVECKECSKLCSGLGGLIIHMKRAHGVTQTEHKCDHCDRVFPSQGKLNQHNMRTHLKVKRFQCDQCSSAFIERHGLTRHIECVHGDTYNYFCERCGKKFKSKKQLRKHVVGVHEKNRRHHCDQCTKSFCSPRDLKAHRLFRHENIRTFQCDKCPVAFSTPVGLKRHAATVHNEGSMQCTQCEKKFYKQYDLYRHVAQAHGGERKYPCDQCNKAYIYPKDLNRHIITIHQGLKPEVCDICHKAFSIKGNLTAHKKKVHKDIFQTS